MGKLDGKVAFITGAARGIGRANAIRLAEEGADIIATDVGAPNPSVAYGLSTPAELAEIAAAVEALGRRCVALHADVRDRAGLQEAFDTGVSALGPVEIVVANAGIGAFAAEPSDAQWFDTIAVNLTGTYLTLQVVVPSMVAAGRGGSIAIINSVVGLSGMPDDAPGTLGYTASKHGAIGLMRAYANTLGPHSIRVNTVHPTGVATTMAVNDAAEELLDVDSAAAVASANALPVGLIDPKDIADAVAWLVSDEARYVTGVTLPVDAGYLVKR